MIHVVTDESWRYENEFMHILIQIHLFTYENSYKYVYMGKG